MVKAIKHGSAPERRVWPSCETTASRRSRSVGCRVRSEIPR